MDAENRRELELTPELRRHIQDMSDALLTVRPLGGSELFVRIQGRFFADAKYISAAIEENHERYHEAMKRAVWAEKKADAQERREKALVEALEAAEQALTQANIFVGWVEGRFGHEFEDRDVRRVNSLIKTVEGAQVTAVTALETSREALAKESAQ